MNERIETPKPIRRLIAPTGDITMGAISWAIQMALDKGLKAGAITDLILVTTTAKATTAVRVCNEWNESAHENTRIRWGLGLGDSEEWNLWINGEWLIENRGC